MNCNKRSFICVVVSKFIFKACSLRFTSLNNCLLISLSLTDLLLLLLQSALQPLWVLVCSTIDEYSRQEGFYRVAFTAARQTLNLEDQWLERSNSRHRESPASETTQANPSSGRWNYGREIAENFVESGRIPRHFWVLLHAVNLRHVTDGFTSPPREGALRIFSPEKSDGWVWTQRPARSPLDHRSRPVNP